MKLKKIASLMLAGIMAVSMLAGCDGKSNNTDDNKDDGNQVVAASVADYANSLLSKNQKNVFEFKDSAELTAALQKVANNSEKFTSQMIKNKYADHFTYDDDACAEVLAKELKNELDLDVVDLVGNAAKLNNVTKEGTRSAGYVYAFSGKLSESAAVQLLVNSWKATMDGGNFFPATVNGYELDYTAEISAVKVTARDFKDASTWVVAIVVNQTATANSTTKV